MISIDNKALKSLAKVVCKSQCCPISCREADNNSIDLDSSKSFENMTTAMAMQCLQAAHAQKVNFLAALKAGDYIDVKDSEGDWFEAVIVQRLKNSIFNTIKCHFINYSSKWDCEITITGDNISPRGTHTQPSSFDSSFFDEKLSIFMLAVFARKKTIQNAFFLSNLLAHLLQMIASVNRLHA